MATQADNKLTPAQKSANFALMTRQYLQSLPSVSFQENSTIRFTLPKARFLQKIYLNVAGTFNLTHASKTTYTANVFDRYNLLKQIRLNVNSGFTPYQLGGSRLHMYNLINSYTSNLLDSDVNGTNVLDNKVSASGAVNNINYTVELPITINDRDTVGLLMLQDSTTVVTVEVDCDTIINSLMTDTDITVSNINIQVTPIIETYSIPSVPTAIPDYSIIKIVNEQLLNVVSAGEMSIPLSTDLTYRKIFFYIATDSKGTPMPLSNIDKVSIQFNNADTPYSIPVSFLAYKNKVDYQGTLPKGCYCLDFSGQGIANLGGSKNYIDTERMTQFELKISFKNVTGNSNYIYVVSEKLAKLV